MMKEYVVMIPFEDFVCDKCRKFIKEGREIVYVELIGRYPNKILCKDCYKKEVSKDGNLEEAKY